MPSQTMPLPLYIKVSSIKYACIQCDYQATKQPHLGTHIQNVHE